MVCAKCNVYIVKVCSTVTLNSKTVFFSLSLRILRVFIVLTQTNKTKKYSHLWNEPAQICCVGTLRQFIFRALYTHRRYVLKEHYIDCHWSGRDFLQVTLRKAQVPPNIPNSERLHKIKLHTSSTHCIMDTHRENTNNIRAELFPSIHRHIIPFMLQCGILTLYSI